MLQLSYCIHSHGEWPKSSSALFTQNLCWLKFAFHIKLESCAPHQIKKYQDYLLLYVIVRFLLKMGLQDKNMTLKRNTYLFSHCSTKFISDLSLCAMFVCVKYRQWSIYRGKWTHCFSNKNLIFNIKDLELEQGKIG